jgi:hypothetical protein
LESPPGTSGPGELREIDSNQGLDTGDAGAQGAGSDAGKEWHTIVTRRLRDRGSTMTIAPSSGHCIARPRTFPFLVAAAMLAQAGLASGAQPFVLGEPTAAASLPSMPHGVPADYVVTPNGFFHPSCVHRIDGDETLQADGRIVRDDGSERRVAACAYPHYAADGTRLARDAVPPLPAAAPRVPPPVINGWVAYGHYFVAPSNAAGFIKADMSVPDPPTVHAGQVDYFFPGLQDAENVITIVQPVLGWNAFNDNGWTIASWNCCLGGETWHSAPVTVEAGVTLEGTVKGSSCHDAVCDDWQIVTRDITNAHETTLNTSGYGQVFDWVFGAVLEVYGVTQCAHLPASGTEEFSRISVRPTRPARSAPPPPAWEATVVASTPNCGYAVTPHPNPNSPQITIDY